MAEFLIRYDVGELLSAKGIAEDRENSNYLIETTTCRFILTLYEKEMNGPISPSPWSCSGTSRRDAAALVAGYRETFGMSSEEQEACASPY